MTTSTIDKEQIKQDCLDYSLFSWAKQGGFNPINAERAKGVFVYDRDGKSYLDFSSQLMNVNIGHGHPKVAEAVARQMQELSFISPAMATEVRAKLSRKLTEITPGDLTKAFYTVSGAESIENAIKLARVYTGRHKILAHYRAYHGATPGAIGAGGDPRKFPLDSQQMPNMVHVENPYAYRCPWNTSTPEECGKMAAQNIERIMKYENPENIAAILVEGESGSSGCIKYPKGYLRAVKDLCEKYGILFIDDEVMSGFGRTGKMFGIEHHGVVPDMMCMAKGLTSGYVPFGALMVSPEIADRFNDQALPIGLTCSAHPLGCAAALANIEIYEEENLIERAAQRGKYIEQKVEELKVKHPSIGDFRNTGLLGCIELVKNRETKEPTTPWNAKPSEMEPTIRMAAKIRELGMHTFVRWNWIFIAPPLIISEEEIDQGMEIISAACAIADEYCN